LHARVFQRLSFSSFPKIKAKGGIHMSEAVISAQLRNEKANKARRQGFIPGVIYGKDVRSASIKVDQKEFRKVLQGRKVFRVILKLGDEAKNCIIKEVQRDPINGQILHVDFQTIHSDDIIRLKVPIAFHGKEKLAAHQLLLQEFITEVEISGKAADLPEFISIDIGDSRLGDKITVADLKISDNIRILEDSNEILAVVSTAKFEAREESEAGSEEEGEATGDGE